MNGNLSPSTRKKFLAFSFLFKGTLQVFDYYPSSLVWKLWVEEEMGCFSCFNSSEDEKLNPVEESSKPQKQSQTIVSNNFSTLPSGFSHLFYSCYLSSVSLVLIWLGSPKFVLSVKFLALWRKIKITWSYWINIRILHLFVSLKTLILIKYKFYAFRVIWFWSLGSVSVDGCVLVNWIGLSDVSGGEKLSSKSNVRSKRELLLPRDGFEQIAAHTFAFHELVAATMDFHPDTFLGEGGFGCVYKGRLETTGQVQFGAQF